VSWSVFVRSPFSHRVAAPGSISAGASFYHQSCVFVGAGVKLSFLHLESAGAAQFGLFHRYLFLLPRCVRLCVLRAQAPLQAFIFLFYSRPGLALEASIKGSSFSSSLSCLFGGFSITYLRCLMKYL
jgi:hypothetical protein